MEQRIESRSTTPFQVTHGHRHGHKSYDIRDHALNSFQQHNGGAWHKKLWYDGMNGGQQLKNNTNNNKYNKNHNTK